MHAQRGSRQSGGSGRWRDAQQNRRRRRWSRRGLATLAVAASLLGLGALHLLHRQTAAEEPRPVLESAAHAPAPIDPPQTAPPVLATQPPVTDRVLQLETTTNDFGAERYVETLPSLRGRPTRLESLRVLYSLDTQLTRHAFEVLRDGKVALGHVILLDPDSGRVLTYASTDVAQFPPNRLYPAASLVKVITAAAALDVDPALAGLPCRYSGSPYALTPRSIDPPRTGHEISLRKALASSNNQCFAQLAVHAVGQEPLIDAISRFGWLSEPAPAHPAGKVEPGEDRFDLGRLGCGLAGARITPLHAAQLAAVLARGELIAPHWIEGVYDAAGRELLLPASAAPRQVMTRELTDDLRAMLIDTTLQGTARRAFRTRNGAPLLGPVRVAGKTGSLSGTDPKGRYEWFVGVAPADEPEIAIAVLLVQNARWWRTASQIAADVLEGVFCEGRQCRPDLAARWLRATTETAAIEGAADRKLN